jgi:hypothetical protein
MPDQEVLDFLPYDPFKKEILIGYFSTIEEATNKIKDSNFYVLNSNNTLKKVVNIKLTSTDINIFADNPGPEGEIIKEKRPEYAIQVLDEIGTNILPIVFLKQYKIKSPPTEQDNNMYVKGLPLGESFKTCNSQSYSRKPIKSFSTDLFTYSLVKLGNKRSDHEYILLRRHPTESVSIKPVFDINWLHKNGVCIVGDPKIQKSDG